MSPPPLGLNRKGDRLCRLREAIWHCLLWVALWVGRSRREIVQQNQYLSADRVSAMGTATKELNA